MIDINASSQKLFLPKEMPYFSNCVTTEVLIRLI